MFKKINSHVLGIGLGIGAAIAMWWWMDKRIETYLNFTIYKAKGKFFVERSTGDRYKYPSFDTIEDAKAWITMQEAKERLKTIIPWGN